MSLSDAQEITDLFQNIQITIPLSSIEGSDDLTEAALTDLHYYCGNLLSGLALSTSNASLLMSLWGIERSLTYFTPAALQSPSLLPLVNAIFGPYDGQNPSDLRPRNRRSADQVSNQLKGLRNLEFGICEAFGSVLCWWVANMPRCKLIHIVSSRSRTHSFHVHIKLRRQTVCFYYLCYYSLLRY